MTSALPRAAGTTVKTITWLAIFAEMNGTLLESVATAQKDWADFVDRRIKEDVAVSRDERSDGVAGVVAGRLSLPMLNATVLSVRVDQQELFAHIPGDQSVLAGDRVWLTFRKCHLFDKQSGARLDSHAEPAPA